MRDLFSYRWAFRVHHDSSSDVVLGQGWAARATPPPTSTRWPGTSAGCCPNPASRRIKALISPPPTQVPGRLRGPPARHGSRMSTAHAVNGHRPADHPARHGAAGTGRRSTASRGNNIAKYATKTLTARGLPPPGCATRSTLTTCAARPTTSE